jgi:hypothetical protein
MSFDGNFDWHIEETKREAALQNARGMICVLGVMPARHVLAIHMARVT